MLINNGQGFYMYEPQEFKSGLRVIFDNLMKI